MQFGTRIALFTNRQSNRMSNGPASDLRQKETAVLTLARGESPAMSGADSVELEPMNVRRDLIVKNANGLHLLPCSVIARTVKDFAGSVKLVNGKQQANAKSPMDMILLGATMGTELTLFVEGPGAKAMADLVERLFADEFMTDR